MLKKRFMSVLISICLLFSACGSSMIPAGSSAETDTISTEVPVTEALTEPETTAVPVTESAPSEPSLPEKMEGDEFGNGAIGRNGGVSCFSKVAAQAGVDILKAGGNAVDAAVAAAFAVGVVEPNHSGIGGCGMMTIYLKDRNEYVTIEYLETTPSGQLPGLYNSETDSMTAKNAAARARRGHALPFVFPLSAQRMRLKSRALQNCISATSR